MLLEQNNALKARKEKEAAKARASRKFVSVPPTAKPSSAAAGPSAEKLRYGRERKHFEGEEMAIRSRQLYDSAAEKRSAVKTSTTDAVTRNMTANRSNTTMTPNASLRPIRNGGPHQFNKEIGLHRRAYSQIRNIRERSGPCYASDSHPQMAQSRVLKISEQRTID